MGTHAASRKTINPAVLADPHGASRAGDNAGAQLDGIRQALLRVLHDVNNPLAIISGNAQLLAELARVLDLEPELAKPIGDIEEASHQLAERLARLAALKEEFVHPVDGD